MVPCMKGEGFCYSLSYRKNIMLFSNVVVSKGSNVDYSHRQLWGIMDCFICVVDDSQDRLIIV